jgi:hypothetical protein
MPRCNPLQRIIFQRACRHNAVPHMLPWQHPSVLQSARLQRCNEETLLQHSISQRACCTNIVASNNTEAPLQHNCTELSLLHHSCHRDTAQPLQSTPGCNANLDGGFRGASCNTERHVAMLTSRQRRPACLGPWKRLRSSSSPQRQQSRTPRR